MNGRKQHIRFDEGERKVEGGSKQTDTSTAEPDAAEDVKAAPKVKKSKKAPRDSKEVFGSLLHKSSSKNEDESPVKKKKTRKKSADES